MTTDTQNKKATRSVAELNAELGRIPPQAVEIEQAVLGALMVEKGAEITVMDILRPESFYVEAHRRIYEVIRKLSSEFLPIDMLTVTDALRKSGDLEMVGGAFYIQSLTSNIGSAAHIEFHARIIAQRYLQRELIRVGSDIQNMAYDPATDVDDLLDFSERQLFEIVSGNIKKEAADMKSIVNEAIRQIEAAGQRTDGLSGVPCGFSGLDRITCGWQRSDLVIVAARPSMGKTAFVLSMARNIAVEHKVSVGIFSLEMANVQLVNRLIVSETELPSDKIRTGKLDESEWQTLERKISQLSEAKIYIDDSPGVSIYEMRAKCRRLKLKYNVEIIIIDYLQLMSGTKETRGNREQEVATISRGLKAIAKELDVPIIALSQLNRSVETRSGDKRPQLSDLRESGAIEQDADIVLFIHRPEKYGISEYPDGTPTKGVAEIIVAKHRNGATGDVLLRFEDRFARFADMDSDYLPPIGDVQLIGSKMNNFVDDGPVIAPNSDTYNYSDPF